jgi:acyl-CoA synthetase (AMP-forming)/AMP-acid ligase II
VVFGGGPLDSRMLLPWFDRRPENTCRMVSMYGITETTVHVTAQTVTRELALAGSRSVGPALPGRHGPSGGRPDGGRDTGLAESLQEIREAVPGTPVGLDDDFFELGGNSLFAVRVSAALRARGLPSLPLRDLYRTPTIRALTTAR